MRNKSKTRNIFPSPLPSSYTHSILILPSPKSYRGMGKLQLQSVQSSSSLSFLSPHAFSVLWCRVPPVGCTLIKFNVGPCHWFCQKTSTFLCFSPWSFWVLAPVWALYRLQLPAGHVCLLQHGALRGLQVDIDMCFTVDLSSCTGTAVLPQSAPWPAREPQNSTPEVPPPPRPLTLVSSGLLLSCFHPCLTAAALYFIFLNI